MTRCAAPQTELRLVPALADPPPNGVGPVPTDDVTMLASVSSFATSHVAEVAPAIRTLIVDSHRLVRAGIRVLLEDQHDVTVAGEASSGDEAVELARQARPDVVVMDVRIAGLDGIQATRQILAEVPGVKVLLLMTSETDESIFEALNAGALGLLVKDSDAGELLRAVRVLATGGTLLSPRLMRRVIDEFVSLVPRRGPSPGDLAELTAREREVMALVAAGLSNEEIARRLVVSPATAKTHVSRTLRKLDARDRAQLVVLAYETGLVVSRHDPASSAASDGTGRA
jgi:DNA-binding NarL/FixJ family response regulator